MEYSNCSLCGSGEFVELQTQTFRDSYLDLIDKKYQEVERKLVKCENCGLIYRSPTLSSSDIEVLYNHFRDSSVLNENPEDYFTRISSLPPDCSENFQKIIWLRRRIPNHLTVPSKILDIGCGGGVFLHTFNNAFPGWKRFGIEPTKIFADLAAHMTEATILNTSYRPNLFPFKFSLVILNQVLEHIKSPVSFLASIREDLNQNQSYLYLEVPDIKDLDILPPDHDRFHSQHLSIFSPSTLSLCCEKAGFEVVDIDQLVTVRNRNNLVALLRPLS